MIRQYLMAAPEGDSNPLGRALLCSDIVAKLKALNPAVMLWEQYDQGLWWPGRHWADTEYGVKTSLWVGTPNSPKSKKISAIQATVVPEFTQIAPDGSIIAKGWRTIFEKVIRLRVTSRPALEAAFGVSLVYEEGTSLLCGGCLKMGKRRRHNGGVAGLCNSHESVLRAARQFLALKSNESAEAIADQNADVDRRIEYGVV